MFNDKKRNSTRKLCDAADEPFEMDAALSEVADAIRRMPDAEPPGILLPSVMKSIRSRRMPLLQRIYRWAKSPRTVTFTPFQLASVASVLVCLFGAFAFHVLKDARLSSFEARHLHRVPIMLSLSMPEAQSVAVVGSFNDWSAKGYEMQMNREQNVWTVTLWLPEGRYEYAFVLDESKIIPDPGAEFLQDDGFGNQNAVLVVASNDEKPI